MKINSSTALYGFFGSPAKQSLSPQMQNVAFENKKINACYLTFNVKKENLEKALFGARAMGVRGLSISIPHKIEVVKFCNSLDENAEKIGAVNTVKFENNKILGFNTDIFGIIDAISEQGNIKNRPVVILGAGGTAHTAVWAVKKMKAAKIKIFNRTLKRAKELAEKTGAEFDCLENFSAKKGSVIINTTSVGLKSNESPISKEKIPEDSIVFDAVYIPGGTKLLSLAKERNAKTVEGLKMLLYQGVKQFEIWTRQKAPKDEMWNAISKQ